LFLKEVKDMMLINKFIEKRIKSYEDLQNLLQISKSDGEDLWKKYDNIEIRDLLEELYIIEDAWIVSATPYTFLQSKHKQIEHIHLEFINMGINFALNERMKDI
jgi:hypothetical protein